MLICRIIKYNMLAEGERENESKNSRRIYLAQKKRKKYDTGSAC